MGGSAIGHVIPGVALFLWSVCLLFLQRQIHCRNWTTSSALKLGAAFQLIGSSIAVGQELIGGFSINDPFHNKDHLTLHSVYFFSGLAFYAEAEGKLPKETWRVAQGFVNFAMGLLIYVHSQMQYMEEHHPVEGFTHWLLSIAMFGASLGYVMSWACPSLKVGMLYIGIDGLMLQAVWLLYQSYSLYSGDYGDMGADLDMADAASFFLWFFLLCTILIALFESKVKLSLGYPDDPENATSNGKVLPYNKVDNAEVEAMLH